MIFVIGEAIRIFCLLAKFSQREEKKKDMQIMYYKDHLSFSLCYFLIYCARQPVVRLLSCSGSYNNHVNAYLFLLPIPLYELMSSIKTS